ncbi:MAG: AAA family ATPase [Pseudorhodobacter sp. PARRP1]|nr:MAG: AAA family ATPase [Pseudorhodobacter sp. PARRP1]
MMHNAPNPNFTSAPRPAWWDYTEQVIRRFQQHEWDKAEEDRSHTHAAADDAFKAALTAHLNGPQFPHSGLDPLAPPENLSPEASHDTADISSALATDAPTELALPPIRIPAHKLLLITRLAASIGNATAFESFLEPSAITVLGGIADDDLDLLQRLLMHVVPEQWSIASIRGSMNIAHCISVVRPHLSEGKISAHAAREFERDILAGIAAEAPLLIIQPTNATLPPGLPLDQIRRISLMPISRDIMIATLRASHSDVGRFDEAAVRVALPDDKALAALDPLCIAVAMRAPSACEVAERLRVMGRTATTSSPVGPHLDAFTGNSPALRAARQLSRDLRAWKDGRISWNDLSRSMLLYGPPGTGKSWLARAIGNSADFTVVTATFGQWQAEGHLGDMLTAMRQCFHNARAAMPTVLIIDEIDSVGSREDRDPHNRSYRTQVINAFLAELDSISREEGVIVIGTCNHPELIDSAVMRAGRFDLKIELPLPDADALLGVLQRHFPEWSEACLQGLAQNAVGCSAADVDAAIRQAKGMARSQEREVTIADLRAVFATQSDPEIDWRVAVHECGHAVVCAALGLGTVRRILLARSGGGAVMWDPTPRHGLMTDLAATLCQHMAGRAAERLIFGEVSAGSGGTAESDLAKATAIAVGIHTRYGLGMFGSLWIGNEDQAQLHDPACRMRVRQSIDDAEARAVRIIMDNRDLLEGMARQLVRTRDLDEQTAKVWLDRVRSPVLAHAPEPAVDLGQEQRSGAEP